MISLHAVSAEVKAAQAYLDFLKQRWPELDESLLELLQARSFPTAHIKKTNAKEY